MSDLTIHLRHLGEILSAAFHDRLVYWVQLEDGFGLPDSDLSALYHLDGDVSNWQEMWLRWEGLEMEMTASFSSGNLFMDTDTEELGDSGQPDTAPEPLRRASRYLYPYGTDLVNENTEATSLSSIKDLRQVPSNPEQGHFPKLHGKDPTFSTRQTSPVIVLPETLNQETRVEDSPASNLIASPDPLTLDLAALDTGTLLPWHTFLPPISSRETKEAGGSIRDLINTPKAPDDPPDIRGSGPWRATKPALRQDPVATIWNQPLLGLGNFISRHEQPDKPKPDSTYAPDSLGAPLDTREAEPFEIPRQSPTATIWGQPLQGLGDFISRYEALLPPSAAPIAISENLEPNAPLLSDLAFTNPFEPLAAPGILESETIFPWYANLLPETPAPPAPSTANSFNTPFITEISLNKEKGKAHLPNASLFTSEAGTYSSTTSTYSIEKETPDFQSAGSKKIENTTPSDIDDLFDELTQRIIRDFRRFYP